MADRLSCHPSGKAKDEDTKSPLCLFLFSIDGRLHLSPLPSPFIMPSLATSWRPAFVAFAFAFYRCFRLLPLYGLHLSPLPSLAASRQPAPTSLLATEGRSYGGNGRFAYAWKTIRVFYYACTRSNYDDLYNWLKIS